METRFSGKRSAPAASAPVGSYPLRFPCNAAQQRQHELNDPIACQQHARRRRDRFARLEAGERVIALATSGSPGSVPVIAAADDRIRPNQSAAVASTRRRRRACLRRYRARLAGGGTSPALGDERVPATAQTPALTAGCDTSRTLASRRFRSSADCCSATRRSPVSTSPG